MSDRSADTVLNESFLEVRAKLLEVAATLDRVDRAIACGNPLSEAMESRRGQLRQAIDILHQNNAGRAEKLQKLFSRDYQPDWRTTFQLSRTTVK
jgi:hypothetical protein